MVTITINGVIFEIETGKFIDFLLWENLKDLTYEQLNDRYPTLYQAYKNPSKKKIVFYSRNALFMHKLKLDWCIFSKHIGIINKNDRTFTDRYCVLIDSYPCFFDFSQKTNKIIVFGDYEKRIDKFKEIIYNKYCNK